MQPCFDLVVQPFFLSLYISKISCIHKRKIQRELELELERESSRERNAMAGLQRSTTSFRRQGSSGLVWDDRFLSGELNQLNQKDQDQEKPQEGGEEDQNKPENMKEVKAPRSINTVERSRSNGGGRGYRTGRVSPAIEPPSPKVSACGFCSSFGKPPRKSNRRTKTSTTTTTTTTAGNKRRSR